MKFDWKWIGKRSPTKMKNKGYSEAGASYRKRSLKSYNASSGSVREDIDYNNQILRERGRDLYMSTPLAASAINTVRTNVVGVGLQLRPSIDKDILGMTSEQAEAWQRQVSNEFSIWADDKRSCDATGMNNFSSIQQLVMLSWLMSGDCFVLLKTKKSSQLRPYQLRLHVIEADRCRTPTDMKLLTQTMTTAIAENGNFIYDGVEVDSDGLVVAYHFSNRHPGEWGLTQMMAKTEWVRVKAVSQKTGLPNVIHLMNSERPDQYRGVTYLAPVIEHFRQLGRYTEAELTAAVVEAFFTAFVKTESDPDDIPFNQTDQYVGSENEYAMGPGQVNVMKPGEDVVFADPKRPAGGFDTFVNAICAQIGAALEIPAELLLKQFNSSYSASRAALLEAWKSFRMRRQWLIDDFCKPVYEVWLSEAVARGRIKAPGFFTDPVIRKAYLGADWIGPSQGQLDPVKEVTAEILSCSEGFSTHEQSTTKLNGGEWDQNIDRLKLENEKLNGQAPDPHQTGIQKEEQPEESEDQQPADDRSSRKDKLVNMVWEQSLKEGNDADQGYRRTG